MQVISLTIDSGPNGGTAIGFPQINLMFQFDSVRATYFFSQPVLVVHPYLQ